MSFVGLNGMWIAVWRFSPLSIAIWEVQTVFRHGKLDIKLWVSEAEVPSGARRAEIVGGEGVHQAWLWPRAVTCLPPAHLRHWVLARSIILSEISSALSKQLNNPWGSQGLLCLGSRQLQGCSDAKVHSPSPNEYIWYRVLVLTSLLESKLTIDYKCHMMEINISRLSVFRILNWQTMN